MQEASTHTSVAPFFDDATKIKMEVTRVFAEQLQGKLTRKRAKRLLKDGKASGMQPEGEISAADVAMQMLSHSPAQAAKPANPATVTKERNDRPQEPYSVMPDDYGLEADESSTGDAGNFMDAYSNSFANTPIRKSDSDNEGEGENASAPPDGEDVLDFMGDDWSNESTGGISEPSDQDQIDQDNQDMSGLFENDAGDQPVDVMNDFMSSLNDDDVTPTSVNQPKEPVIAARNKSQNDTRNSDREMSNDMKALLKAIRG